MRLNDNCCISKNNGNTYLVNIDNGDVFLINNVVETLVNLCEQYDTPKSLAIAVFDIYKDTKGDFSLCELVDYIEEMVNAGFLSCQ